MGFIKHHRLMWTFTSALFDSLKRPVFLFLTTASFSIMTIGAALFYLAEKDVNPDVTRFFDADTGHCHLATGVGLGDITAQTDVGRIISMRLMLVGTAIYVSFTVTLSVSIIEIEVQHRQSKSKPDKK